MHRGSLRRMAEWVCLIGLSGVLGLAGLALAQSVALPPDSEYVVIDKEGHLQINGQRVRFWGAIGNFPCTETRDGRDPYADNEMLVQRLKDLGFNMIRYWSSSTNENYTKGDKSRDDLIDYFLFLCKKAGIRVWCASLRGGGARASDVSLIDDPATADPWVAAISSGGSGRRGGGRNLYAAWDRRTEIATIRGRKAVLNHVNKHTGLRYADDPVFAIWELTNEEWWFGHMIAGEWQNQAGFFQQQLVKQWNVFLKEKYQSEDALRKRWLGLLPGESLEKGTIMLAPMRNPTGPVALNDPNAVVQIRGVAQAFSREDFNGRRASDVIEFFLKIWIDHKQRESDAIKSVGKGISRAPLVWDTGIGYEIEAQYMQQHAGAIAHDTYIGGTHHDPNSRRFPFMSGLEELPRLCWNAPWVEQNRMSGKPYLVYETQIENTGKYRAEFPMRVASLASIQDWDAVCWHYYGFGRDARDPKPYEQKLDVGHSLDLHYQFDEVQLSAMRAASEVMKTSALQPPANPTQFIFGRKALLDPASMDYDGSYGEVGKLMLPTTYRYGVRLLIDPTLDGRPDDPLFRGADGQPDKAKYDRFVATGSMVIGPAIKPRVYESNPIRPTGQIEYDWQKGHLIFESPATASYTGFLAQYGSPQVKFKNGITFKDVSVSNPKNMPYPVTEEEKFVVIAVNSADGQPLASAKRVIVSAVSTSFNTGYNMGPPQGERFPGKVTPGILPVLVARVGCTIDAPALTGMKYRFFDWHMNTIAKGTVSPDGVLKIGADQPVFYAELTR